MMIFFSLTPCQAVLKYWAAKAVTGKFAIKETRIDTLVSEWLALRTMSSLVLLSRTKPNAMIL